MRIDEHAVDRYVERLMNISTEQAGEALRDYARDKIKETVMEPEIIYNGKDDYCPIYIKGDVAVPYDDGIVPTTYRADTFTKKIQVSPDTTTRGVS